MRKNLFLILAVVIGFCIPGACKKMNVAPKPIDLGVKSTTMSYVAPPTVTNNTLSATINVTPGAKYSLQLIDFNGDVVAKQGIAADEIKEILTLDVSKVEAGSYDVILINTDGQELKNPIIIK